MRCERCRARIRGATWYCPSCGAPVRDLNVADSVRGPSLRRLTERGLSLLGLAAASALLLAGGWWLLGRSGASGGARLAWLRSWGAGGAGAPPPAGSATLAGAEGETAGGTAAATATAAARASAPSGADGVQGAALAAYPTGLPPRPGVPVWHLGRPAAPPVIDGLLDDWQPPLIRAARLPLETVVFGPEAWSGPSDLAGEAFGAWDDRALYLAVAVRDERPSPPARGARLYEGDSLEIQLDTQLLADWESAVFDDDDWHVGLSPGDLLAAAATAGPSSAGRAPSLRPEAWVWRPEGRKGPLELPLAAAPRPGGYALELALPWSLLGLTPQSGLVLGLSLSASDNDRAAPAQESMVSSSPLRRWDDPRSMGLLVLDP